MPINNAKYLGRHNRNRTVGLYVQDKTVYEYEREAVVTPLRGIIQTAMPGVRIGALAKIIGGPAGLGFGVPSGVVWGCQSIIGEDSKFFKFHTITELQEGYLAFEFISPSQFIPSLPLSMHPATKTMTACLKWYLYAEEPLSKSRVFLSINRVWVADPVRVKSVAASAGRVSRNLLCLSARLDSSCYYSGDTVKVGITLEKPANFRFNGFKLTAKQILDVAVINSTNSSRSTSWAIKKNLNRIEYNVDWYKQVKGRSPSKLYLNVERVQEQLEIALDPNDLKVEVFMEAGVVTNSLAPSFDSLSLFPNGSRRLCCTLHYYLNVHVIIPWSANLIVSLPFSIVSSGIINGFEDVGKAMVDVNEIERPRSQTTEMMLAMPTLQKPLLSELPFLDDVQQALQLLDQFELGKKVKQHKFDPKGADSSLSGLHNVSLSFIYRNIDPLAGQSVILSRHARTLTQNCIQLDSADLNDAIRLLLTRLQEHTLNRDRLEDGVKRISNLLPKI